MDKSYDSSWDKGNDDAFNRKEREWAKRNWWGWLNKNLTFPFTVKREEDEDDAYFTDIAKREPFRLCHVMEVLNLETEDDLNNIIIKVKENEEIGYVPLCDVEVTSKKDENFWPVREYVVWFANR